jgi:tetratricopeptide (TPR) repeat protein
MKRLLRRLWFPVALAMVVVVGFVALGPLSALPSFEERLRAMAPPGASADADVAFEPAIGATRTEIEIARGYNAVRTNPGAIAAYVVLGDAYLQHVRETGDPQDYGRAQAALDEAHRLAPTDPDALVGLGVLALARHDFSVALALGQQAVSAAPRSAQAHGVLVDALTELGRYPEAVDAAQQMVDLRPDLASLSRIAYQRELRGDLEGATDIMTRAFDAAAGTNPENREYIRVLIGDLFLLRGDAATARQIYQAALETLPDFVWANAGMARAAVANGDLATAIDNYHSATDTLPVPELFVALGEAQEAAGRTNEANASYELVRAMQKLFVQNGVNVDLELALFEANHGDPSTAVALAQRAYAEQRNVKAADALGWAFYKAGSLDQAAKYSAEALSLGSVYPSFEFHAGMIALAQNRFSDAQAHLARAAASTGTLSPLDLATARAALVQADAGAR